MQNMFNYNDHSTTYRLVFLLNSLRKEEVNFKFHFLVPLTNIFVEKLNENFCKHVLTSAQINEKKIEEHPGKIKNFTLFADSITRNAFQISLS